MPEVDVSAVDRESARSLVEEYLRQVGRTEFSVEKLCDVSEIRTRLPSVYGVRIDDRCWIAYLRGPMTGFCVKSSDIVVLSKETGRVLYFGSANDEG